MKNVSLCSLLWKEVNFVELQMNVHNQVIGFPLNSSFHVN